MRGKIMGKKGSKKSVFAEFKEFILRGNVVDMAIGIIIGSAFTAIVSSFVADIFNPLLGCVIGDIDFAELRIILREAVIVDGVEQVAEVAIRYGVLIEKIITFLLTALVLFAIIKGINRAKAAKEKLNNELNKDEIEAKAKADAEATAAKAAADAEAAAKEAAAKQAEEEAKKEQLQLLRDIKELLKK